MKNLLPLFLLFLFASCQKDKETCWQVYDALGNELTQVCDKSESEINAQYGAYYDRSDAAKYCWRIESPAGNFSYPENLTEKLVAVYYPGVINKQKITCGYCQRWATREKGIGSLTGNYAYKPVEVQTYCGDTCNTLYPGRIVMVRKTPDSLITVEFLQRY
ncbi:MAG: hypothetical protein NTW29_01530 [Bacteroidetes bacterium]|nr:hypothetical protein [Bacteroidota bacterium]